MSDLFIDLDAENEPTLWRENGDYPIALARKCEMHERAWAVIVVGVLFLNDGRVGAS